MAHPLIDSFEKVVESLLYIGGTLVGPGNRVMNKTNKVPALMGLIF